MTDVDEQSVDAAAGGPGRPCGAQIIDTSAEPATSEVPGGLEPRAYRASVARRVILHRQIGAEALSESAGVAEETQGDPALP